MFSRFQLGVCYYPEHWPASQHASDFRRIKQAGFDVVRLGEGAWSYFEPVEGKFQFDLFDRAIDLCRKNDLRVIFGTPTYCGPAWIATQYPEVLRWNFQRIPMKHGTRRHFNYTGPKFLDLSDKICTALAEHYSGEKQIVAWQLDNELNCHMDVSYAPSDTTAFRAWLKSKYRTLDNLNRAWGTAFWSQTYTDWNEIDLPHPSAASPYLNPTQLLDETRFISDTVVRFARRQADILRAHNKNWLITHNGLFGNVDGPALATQLDFFCHDQYPLFTDEWAKDADGLVQARSLSFPFGIMEQQSGPGGQMTYLQRTPRPGELRLWAWQSVAHGAKLLSFFRWRTCPYGAEQHWHGLLDCDSKDTRRLAEAKLTGKEMHALPDDFFEAAPVKAVGVLRDFDNETNERRINTYTKHGAGEHARWRAVLARRHIPVDYVWPNDSFTDYKALIAPHQKIVTPALAKKLTAYVKAGGTLILGAQSGTKDSNCFMLTQTPPGPLARLAGIEVEDWTTLPAEDHRTARLNSGALIHLSTFVERLRPTTAEALGYWQTADSLLGPTPAVTRNRIGKGQVIYIAGYSPEAAIGTLIAELEPELNLNPPLAASQNVEAIIRRSPGATYLLLLNHATGPETIASVPISIDLLTGKAASDPLQLPGRGVAVLKMAKKVTF
jgi:beta-galactosidase